MLEDMWKEARKYVIFAIRKMKGLDRIREIIVDFQSNGALSTSDETQLHIALIKYMYRAGACYDVEILNFAVHAAVQAIV